MENADVRALSDFVEVSFRASDQIIVFRWLCPFLNDAEFQLSYHLLLETAVQHRCTHWLLDIRRRYVNTPAQDQWVINDYCTLIKHAFPNTGPVHAAYFVSPAALAHYTNTLGPSINARTLGCYRVAAFLDEGMANAWLQEQPKR